MRHYSEEFKSSIIAKMLAPNNVAIPELAQETGIPKDTLYSWRLKHQRGNRTSTAKQGTTGQFSSEEKFSIILESASLNEIELSEYCRRKGGYLEQIKAWRENRATPGAG